MSSKATRVAFGETLARLGGENSDIVVLDADLSKSTMTDYFAKKYPDRFFDVGIAEGNMVGMGAGMALAGKIPFICSFSCFVGGRFEQIRMSVGYNRANVKIVGTHAGIGIGEDGYSQMAIEDIALMRTLPNMAVIQPADGLETERAVEYIHVRKGAHHRSRYGAGWHGREEELSGLLCDQRRRVPVWSDLGGLDGRAQV